MGRKLKKAAIPCLRLPAQSQIAQSQIAQPAPKPHDPQTQDAAAKRHRTRKRKRKPKPSPRIPNKGFYIPNVYHEDAAQPRPEKQKGSNDSTDISLLLHTSPTGPSSSELGSNFQIAAPHPTFPGLNSPSPPPVPKPATSLLELFKTRSTRLQSTITVLQTLLQSARKKIRLLAPEDPVDQLFTTIAICEEILALALEHLTQMLIHEYALRDVLDEVDGLMECGAEDLRRFWDMKRAYGERLFPLLGKLSPEVMGVVVGEMVGMKGEVDERKNTACFDRVDERD